MSTSSLACKILFLGAEKNDGYVYSRQNIGLKENGVKYPPCRKFSWRFKEFPSSPAGVDLTSGLQDHSINVAWNETPVENKLTE